MRSLRPEETIALPNRGLRSDESEEVVPIVTVVARAGDVEGFLSELAIKLDGVFRRDGGPGSHERFARDKSFGELRVDKEARRTTVSGIEVCLTAVEFRVLLEMVEHPDQVLTRGDLLRGVWGLNELTKTRTVDTHVKRLRDKLTTAGRFIQTVRGEGYRFSERPTPYDLTRRRRDLAATEPVVQIVAGTNVGLGR